MKRIGSLVACSLFALTPMAAAGQEGAGDLAEPPPSEEPLFEEPAESASAPRTRADLLPEVVDILGRFDCLACHAPDAPLREALDPAVAPDLAGVTERTSTAWLIDFLLDPRAVRSGTHHPHQLIGIPENVRDSVALNLTHFLYQKDGGIREQLPVETASLADLETGRALFHEVGCVACHGPVETAEDLGYSLVDLSQMDPVDEDPLAYDGPLPKGVLEPDFHALPEDLARKMPLSALAAFLEDPLKVRPGGFCPSMSLEKGEARAIAAYLLRSAAQRVDGSYERRPGLLLQTFHAALRGRGAFKQMAREVATSESVVRSVGEGMRMALAERVDDFGLRFSGLIDVPEEGEYVFHLASDDGSRLFVGGAEIIDNGGTHPVQEKSGSVVLEAGLHAFMLEYFEAGGGQDLFLEWTPPGGERGQLPLTAFSHWPLEYRVQGADGQPLEDSGFVLEPARAERGKQAFEQLGCAMCHASTLPDAGPPVQEATSFAQLEGLRPGVLICLRKGRRYDFETDTVGRLLSAFVDSEGVAADVASPKSAVERTLTRRRCYSCHRRDDVGGVHPALMPYFTGDENAELGDQGRFPPTLTQVGRKFRPSVLEKALRGEEKVRPYLNTRMPKIGADNVGRLADRLKIVDLSLDSVSHSDVEAGGEIRCSTATIDVGRRLSGDRGGLGCVQCHRFLGTKSLGVQAVDMGQMHRRLRFEWFQDLLREPASVDMDSRMASFWVDGASPIEDLAGGDIDQQIEALWCWLGEGESMAPPPGLDTGPWAFEVDPSAETRLVSVFMKDVSPRTLCVGTPAGVHFAFDEQNGRLAKAWRGRFLNAMGTWQGRAGALESPGAKDVNEFLPGFAVVTLDRLNAVWPAPRSGANPGGLTTRALGRTVHADGGVTMRYAVGDLRVAETIRPVEVGIRISKKTEPDLRMGVERSFEVRMARSDAGQPVVARIAAARLFERAGTGRWRVNGGDWPIYTVDESSVRTAKIIQPKEDSAAGFGSTGRDRPSVDGRNRGRSADPLRPEGDGPPLSELRIPVLMSPATDGTGDLVGQFSWSYAW